MKCVLDSSIKEMTMNNTKTDYRQLFVDFLTRKEIHDKFVKNYKADKNLWKNKPLDSFFEIANPWDYIYQAFPWTKTEEGYSYWEKIHREWLERIDHKVTSNYLWIARDKCGTICLHSDYPQNRNGNFYSNRVIILPNNMYPEVTYEDSPRMFLLKPKENFDCE